MGGVGDVDVAEHRQPEEDQQPQDPNPDLQPGVDAQRMTIGPDEAGKEEASSTQAGHERCQQYAEGDRGRADNQLEKLKPDHLVDERTASAGDEQQ
jgi:hypothetical protein